MGKVTRVPEPTTTLIIPAQKPARKIAAASSMESPKWHPMVPERKDVHQKKMKTSQRGTEANRKGLAMVKSVDYLSKIRIVMD